MTDLFRKLNFKSHDCVVVINEPESFIPETEQIKRYTNVLKAFESVKSTDFFIAFVTYQEQVDQIALLLPTLIIGDGVIWFAYPKQTSKKYKCDINRDRGWSVLSKLGYEPVRQIAVDTDWSALRFRHVDFIKKMTRKWTRS